MSERIVCNLIQENNEIPRLLLDIPADKLLFGFDIYASTLTSAIMAIEWDIIFKAGSLDYQGDFADGRG